MLHRINIPACRAQLEWIVQLQWRLLTALCQPDVKSQDITVDWVIAQSPDLGHRWVTTFCSRKDQIDSIKRPMLQHMQAIAGLASADKQALVEAFEHDQQFHLAFEANSSQPRRLRGLSSFQNQGAVEAVRGFFESFYAPNFYANAGYDIPQVDGSVVRFHRGEFFKHFQVANPQMCVCPMCDGDWGEPHVDHFYPKSQYPYLSCHPLNLVPICPTCNSPQNKGEKLPLTSDKDDPMTDWFHPYLRSAQGSFQVRFERLADGTTPVLFSPDPQVQARLDNLEHLIKLNQRWRKALSREFQVTLRRIEKRCKATGHPMSKEELVAKLSEWAEDEECEIGLKAFGLVSTRYLQCAASGDAVIFDELWIYNVKADALTGK